MILSLGALVCCILITRAVVDLLVHPEKDCMVNLEHIALELNRYAAANKGNYPDDLYPLIEDGSISYRQLVCVKQHDRLEGYTAENFTRQDYDNLMDKSDYVYVGQGVQVDKMMPERIIMFERWKRHAPDRRLGMITLDHSSAWFKRRFEGLHALERWGIAYPPKWQKEVGNLISQE